MQKEAIRYLQVKHLFFMMNGGGGTIRHFVAPNLYRLVWSQKLSWKVDILHAASYCGHLQRSLIFGAKMPSESSMVRTRTQNEIGTPKNLRFDSSHDEFSLISYFDLLSRAGRVPGGTIVLSRERTEQSRTIPSFRKKQTLRTRS